MANGARALFVLVILAWLTSATAQVSVTTYHNDLARTGQNTQETILTTKNVNSNQFGKLFSVPVDGVVYAQPLYLWGVNIAGGTHNVLYIADEHDSVYAIDADNGAVYAQVSLIPSGGSTINSSTDLGCTDLLPETGITGTPVIDPATGTMYLVAQAKLNGAIVQHLHALDVGTLAEKFGGPVQITASVPGTASDGSGGVVSFNPKQHSQRAGLLLTNGHVIIGFSSHCDNGTWHGWLLSYNAGTLAQEAAFNASPNGSGNGIWMSGGAPAADASGNIYFPTGNGDWNGTTDWGDSILKLGTPANGTFPLLDYFTPWNQSALQKYDNDLAAGGLVLLPPLPSGKELLAQQGKAGTIYLLDSANLGKYCIKLAQACNGKDTQIIQEIPNASSGIWGSPAYWNGNLYWTGANDSINAYSFNANNSGLISTSPTSHSAQVFAWSAPTPIVSSNGTSNGILWALDGSTDMSTCSSATCLGLFAYDANNLANLLYTSRQAPNNRDSPGNAVKFESPIVANGKVYVGTQNSVTAYGLLAAAAPTFSPGPGTYSTAQSVTLSDTTAGASIYYTTDGTTPTANSARYNSGTPILVGSSMTIKAIATANGLANSAVAISTYVIGNSSATEVSLGSANVDGIVNDGSAVPNGGLDSSGSAYSATLLGTSLSWNGSTYMFGAAGSADAVSGATIALPAGQFTTLSLLATAVHGNQPSQVFTVNYSDGSVPITQSVSDWFTPQNYKGESKALTMGYRLNPNGSLDNRTFYLYGYAFPLDPTRTPVSLTLPKNRNVVVLAVDVSGTTTPAAATPTFSPVPGTYGAAQSVTLSDTTAGASIHYTIDGTTPTANSARYNSGAPILVGSSMTIKALAVASGYANSQVASGLYVISNSSATEVSLVGSANVDGIVNDGSAVRNGGLDGTGDAYSATLLGSSLSWNGNTYMFGAAGGADAVSSATIALPAGKFSTLSLLATAVHGNQAGRVFTVYYSDGSWTSFTQSLSDWGTPQNYLGEAQALTMAYRVTQSGSLDNHTFYLYGYSFALDATRTPMSLTLPMNRDVVVLAVDLH